MGSRDSRSSFSVVLSVSPSICSHHHTPLRVPHWAHGHITVGGSICAEFLTTTGWKASEMNMNYILRSICGLLWQGQAKLEPSFRQSEYTLSEAKEAFQRVASQHVGSFRSVQILNTRMHFVCIIECRGHVDDIRLSRM